MAEGRIVGIEWLRAIMSVFVVAWHLGGGGTSAIWTSDWQTHVFTASDFVNFHLLLLAVPSFMLISNFLLAVGRPDAATVWRRSQRIGALLLFWPLLYLIFLRGWSGVANDLPGTAGGWLAWLLTAGRTVYYFFVSVLITYALTLFATPLATSINVALLVVASAVVGFAPLATAHFGWPELSAYWSPINFLPYPFGAVVIARLFNRDSPVVRALAVAVALLALGAALAVIEWHLYPHASLIPGQSFAFPAYTRPSLVALSMALLIIAIRANLGLPAVIGFMAKYSLALYCLHLFAAEPMRLVVEAVAGGLPPLGKAWLLIALTMATSYVAARLLSEVWKDRLLF